MYFHHSLACELVKLGGGVEASKQGATPALGVRASEQGLWQAGRRKSLVGGGDEEGWPAIGQAKCMAQPYPSPLLCAQYLPALLPHSPPLSCTAHTLICVAPRTPLHHIRSFAPGSQGHVVRALTSLLFPEWLSSLRGCHGGGSWVPWCACILSPLWCGVVWVCRLWVCFLAVPQFGGDEGCV